MKLFKMLKTSIASTVAIAAATVIGQPVHANSLEDLYKGKTITIMLGHPPGGSYDLYSQLAAEFMGRHIPGNPEIIVQHRPGGGGRKGAAFFLNKTQPDGMTLGVFPDSLGQIQYMRPKAASWDAKKFQYIGRFSTANVGFAVRSEKAKSADQLKGQQIIVACTGKNARAAQQAAALKNVVGYDFKLIAGYKGSQATVMAALRGEADMLSQNYASYVSDPGDLGDGALNIVIQTGLERDPGLPNVPLMQELTDDPMGKQVLTYLGASAAIGRAMMIHPETPDYIIKGMREAFQKMINDKDFLAEAKKRKAIITPATGAELNKIMADQMNVSEKVLAAAKAAVDTSSAGSVKKN